MLNDLNKTFSENPVMLDMHRSTFSIGQTHKTTMFEGDLVPVFIREVLPGDTFSVDTSMLIRMATPVFPVMDNAFIDLYFFYVPNRIVWSHWKEFMGENTSAPWSQNIVYTVPQIKFGDEFNDVDGSNVSYYNSDFDGKMVGPSPNHVMNYFGIPTSIYPRPSFGAAMPDHKTPFVSVSDLPNRAYRLIWNEFFRDQNVQAPVPFYMDDSNRQYNPSSDPLYNYGGPPFKVNKFHDYFTSCLPSPQKSSSVVSLAFPERFVPVHATGTNQDFGWSYPSVEGSVQPLHFSYGNYNSAPMVPRWEWSSANQGSRNTINSGPDNRVYLGSSGQSGSGPYGTPDNLYADFVGINLTNVSVLRQAFAVQRLYEAFARGGTRYREMLKSIFGVTSPDARVQVPEYLGGDRIPINMDQVLQTSSTDNVSPQGNTAGYSLTTNVQHSFTKSFVEHGMVIGVACIRVEHTYCQGIEPYWFRKRMFDFYFPQFANLSEQPVYKKYLCATGFSEYDDSVFGYQEAWADYRYTPNRLSGSFSPVCVDRSEGDTVDVDIHNSSLADAWTYNDFYALKKKSDFDQPDFSECPTLSADWMRESDVNVGQTLAVQNEPQFICDFRFTGSATRPMPVRSIPGLIDHH